MPDSEYRDSTDMLVPLNRRNYVLGIVNGVLVALGTRLADPMTVLPLVLVRLTEVTWPVGLLQAIVIAGPAIPAVLASRFVDTAERKLPIFINYSIIRFMAVTSMATAVLFGHHMLPLLVALLLLGCYATYVLAMGVSTMAFVDTVAKSIPTTKRGSFWMWRQTVGALLTITIAVPLIRYLTGEQWADRFPANYGILMLMSAMTLGLSWVAYGFVHEPRGRPAHHRLTIRQQVARGARFWRHDIRYRRMIRVLLLCSSAGAVGPFFTAFAVTVWEFPDTVAATFVTVQILALMAGAVLQGWLSDRHGNRKVLMVAAFSALFTASVAVVAAVVAPVGYLDFFGYPVSYRLLLLCVCFAGSGVFTAQLWVGHMNYIMDIAPARKRPSYVGFTNVFMLPVGLVPIMYGWLAGAVGFEVVFGIAALVAAAAVVLSLRMPEPRDDLTVEQLQAFS